MEFSCTAPDLHRPHTGSFYSKLRLRKRWTKSRLRIVAVIPPAGMVEMKNKVPVVGNNGMVERQPTHAAPVFEFPPRITQYVSLDALIGQLDMKDELALWYRIALVENLSHHLIAKIEPLALNPWLIGGDDEAHEIGRPRQFRGRLAEFRDLMELALRCDLVSESQNDRVDKPGPWRQGVTSGVLRSSASLM
jgi:hypothetical protein